MARSAVLSGIDFIPKTKALCERDEQAFDETIYRLTFYTMAIILKNQQKVCFVERFR